MAGDDDGLAHGGQLAEHLEHLHPALRVQAGQWLIQQDQGRFIQQRPGDHELLLVPARE